MQVGGLRPPLDRDLGQAAVLDELGNAWRHALDPGSRTAIDYGVHGVPETFFVDPDGNIGMKHIGPVTWSVVQANIDSLLAIRTE